MDFKIIAQGITKIDYRSTLSDLSHQDGNAKMYIQVNIDIDNISTNVYRVDINFALNAKWHATDKDMYSFIFTHSCIVRTCICDENKIERMLYIEVPTYVLPLIDAYVKAITGGTGYEVFSICDIDFERIYKMIKHKK